MVLVKHAKDEREPRAKEAERGGRDLGRKDAVFYAENRRAGYTEEKLVFSNVLCRNWRMSVQASPAAEYTRMGVEGVRRTLVRKVLTNASTGIPGSQILQLNLCADLCTSFLQPSQEGLAGTVKVGHVEKWWLRCEMFGGWGLFWWIFLAAGSRGSAYWLMWAMMN